MICQTPYTTTGNKTCILHSLPSLQKGAPSTHNTGSSTFFATTSATYGPFLAGPFTLYLVEWKAALLAITANISFSAKSLPLLYNSTACTLWVRSQQWESAVSCELETNCTWGLLWNQLSDNVKTYVTGNGFRVRVWSNFYHPGRSLLREAKN